MARSRMALTADQLLTRKAMTWATHIRVNPSRIAIADLPKKWGSCAPDGVITLAQDLVDMPEKFQDYVVVHELLHLRYRSHGKAFTAMMTALVPGWRELEASSSVREVRR
ncbi:M48 family metallopeptidase [Saccharopolyspora taberi]|uniref:YgjP-like metallopeptidase domain-containing protein n=1 Tax=Saccharopolyspora taberi TaxID=60895 RepID=A0ABN3VNJ9_9PSEU